MKMLLINLLITFTVALFSSGSYKLDHQNGKSNLYFEDAPEKIAVFSSWENYKDTLYSDSIKPELKSKIMSSKNSFHSLPPKEFLPFFRQHSKELIIIYDPDKKAPDSLKIGQEKKRYIFADTLSNHNISKYIKGNLADKDTLDRFLKGIVGKFEKDSLLFLYNGTFYTDSLLPVLFIAKDEVEDRQVEPEKKFLWSYLLFFAIGIAIYLLIAPIVRIVMNIVKSTKNKFNELFNVVKQFVEFLKKDIDIKTKQLESLRQICEDKNVKNGKVIIDKLNELETAEDILDLANSDKRIKFKEDFKNYLDKAKKGIETYEILTKVKTLKEFSDSISKIEEFSDLCIEINDVTKKSEDYEKMLGAKDLDQLLLFLPSDLSSVVKEPTFNALETLKAVLVIMKNNYDFTKEYEKNMVYFDGDILQKPDILNKFLYYSTVLGHRMYYLVLWLNSKGKGQFISFSTIFNIEHALRNYDCSEIESYHFEDRKIGYYDKEKITEMRPFAKAVLKIAQKYSFRDIPFVVDNVLIKKEDIKEGN